MSMLQVQHLCTPYVRPERSGQGVERPETFYFMYDNYFDWQDFQARNEGAVPFGAGCLDGWQWHINATGTVR